IPTEELRAAWTELVEQWQSINSERTQRGERPMKPGWIWHKFRGRFGRKPPPGCRLPPEVATEKEKSAALEQLQKTAREMHYKPGWALHRFRTVWARAGGVTMSDALADVRIYARGYLDGQSRAQLDEATA